MSRRIEPGRGEWAVRTEALTRHFGAVRAVQQLTLEVPAGTIFGFLGPNGAGKTTTIRLLLGLIAPTSGRAAVLGYDTRTQADAIRREAGALLEYPGIYERLSAEDNLEFYGRAWRLPTAERRARIKELLVHMDLWERRRDSPALWSRGMRQKLALARVLLHRPAIIFLDEPSAGLDPEGAVALGESLLALARREGVTVFLTTHNLGEAEHLCDQLGIIRDGQLLAVGSPDEIRARAGGPRAAVRGRGFSAPLLERLREQPGVLRVDADAGCARLELRDGAPVASLVRLLVTGGADVEEVQRYRPSLEAAYLALVSAEP
jgi:ABC-2 type transport system ATP-binding protein